MQHIVEFISCTCTNAGWVFDLVANFSWCFPGNECICNVQSFFGLSKSYCQLRLFLLGRWKLISWFSSATQRKSDEGFSSSFIIHHHQDNDTVVKNTDFGQLQILQIRWSIIKFVITWVKLHPIVLKLCVSEILGPVTPFALVIVKNCKHFCRN